ncbi:MAG TPA: hypothetical protein RMH99_06175 [Sandaracinaceae bacterium LLY-WYZ-13_1]|nr:hypothetical protein [Sandaracinaceae bacterium LLY-WYZ-13_1]
MRRRWTIFAPCALLLALGACSVRLVDEVGKGSGPGPDAPDAGEACAACGDEGACVDLRTDEHHCGACGRACDADERCGEGECVPASDCGVTCGDDECVDLETDPVHCGMCESPCGPGETCRSGLCTDGSGVMCDGRGSACDDGACHDHEHAQHHCGACGASCDDAWVCDGGECVPPVSGQLRIAHDPYAGGRVEVFFGASWGTVCLLDSMRAPAIAQVVCEELERSWTGSLGGASGLDLPARPPAVSGLRCTGDEARLADCPRDDAVDPDCRRETELWITCR